MPEIIYTVKIPDGIRAVEIPDPLGLRVEEEGSRRLILRVNTKIADVKKTVINPVRYAPYHTTRRLNLRTEPHLDNSPIRLLPVNTNLSLSTEVVSDDLLARLGLEMYFDDEFTWRHVQGGGFVAVVVDGQATVAEGDAPVSVPPAPIPVPSPAQNLRTVMIGNKIGLTLKGVALGTLQSVNMRPLAFCGITSHANGTVADDIPRLLDAARDLGVRVIRFYTACNILSPSVCAERVQYVLDEMAKRNQYGILVLNDSLGSGFHVPGDEDYRDGNNMGHLIHTYWHAQAWRGAYVNHVRAILNKVGKHPSVVSFDLINELGGYGFAPGAPIPPTTTQEIKNFVVHCAALVRSLTPQMINLGIINAAHAGCDTPAKAEAFYRMSGLSIIGVHIYREERGGWVQEARSESDAAVAHKMGMACWVDEFGAWYFGQNRRPDYAYAFGRYSQWAAMISSWGYNPLSAQKHLSDNLGVSVHIPDYNDLISLIRSLS